MYIFDYDEQPIENIDDQEEKEQEAERKNDEEKEENY